MSDITFALTIARRILFIVPVYITFGVLWLLTAGGWGFAAARRLYRECF